jgi:hypothetical protein
VWTWGRTAHCEDAHGSLFSRIVSRKQYLPRMYKFAFLDDFSGKEWNDGTVVDVLDVDPVHRVSCYQLWAILPENPARTLHFLTAVRIYQHLLYLASRSFITLNVPEQTILKNVPTS